MEQVKSKILLVEDDTNFGKVLKNYLELNDFVVELARDGILGLAAFKREKFDLCICDVMMPNLDGFSLGEEIRNIDPDVPLFFLTAKNMKTGSKLSPGICAVKISVLPWPKSSGTSFIKSRRSRQSGYHKFYVAKSNLISRIDGTLMNLFIIDKCSV